VAGALYLDNLRIWTGDRARQWASSVLISDGRVVGVGSEEPPGKVRRLDGRGGVAVSGLIDAHLHLLLGAAELEQVDLSGIRTRRAFEEAIAAGHESLPAGEWLIAAGWSEENLPADGAPDKSWLRECGDRPVVCHRMDHHVVLVNDAVLGRIDVGCVPPTGKVGRTERGEPNGLLYEAAAWELVNPIIPSLPIERRQQQFLHAQRHAHQHGLTAVGSMEYSAAVRNVYEPMRSQLSLRCRITLLDRDWPLDVSFGREFSDDERLAVIGYKTYIDGTLGSRTARMLEDYADDPGNRGLLLELAADGRLEQWATHVSEADLSPSMHAIGDEAARLALNAVLGVSPAARARIEHAQQLAEEDIVRFDGMIASMQPLHKADDGRYAERRVGAKRLAGTFAFRRLLDAGARLAFGSDWPIVSCDPLLGIRAAVTGLTLDEQPCLTDQNLTVEEAIHAYTTGSAFALGMDDAGVLAPGKVGDLTVMDRDPFTADWVDNPPRVVMTIVGGEVVYDAMQ